jgi:hypothetical protein
MITVPLFRDFVAPDCVTVATVLSDVVHVIGTSTTSPPPSYAIAVNWTVDPTVAPAKFGVGLIISTRDAVTDGEVDPVHPSANMSGRANNNDIKREERLISAPPYSKLEKMNKR